MQLRWYKESCPDKRVLQYRTQNDVIIIRDGFESKMKKRWSEWKDVVTDIGGMAPHQDEEY